MFGPLKFGGQNISSASGEGANSEINSECLCLGCDNSFNISVRFDIFIKHLFEMHRLVIEDIQTIANIPEYMRWWRRKLNNREIACGLIPEVDFANSNAANNKYYFLSPLLNDDRNIRQHLQLEKVLRTQEYERTDLNYRKECLFCRLHYEGSRAGYVEHLSQQHNLTLGKVQNLVYIEELVLRLEQRLTCLKCIYCEKTFPDRAILKEHMRKKGHKRIRPQDKEYDRFYVVNYLPKESTPAQQQSSQEEDPALNENCDAEYADWIADPNETDRITCLFCSERSVTLLDIERHMHDVHHFHLSQVMDELSEHYLRVKAVNYVRRQMFRHTCPYCEEECQTAKFLQKHLVDEQHYRLPEDRKVYDRPEYFFSTYEDDALLYLIVDPDPDAETNVINETGGADISVVAQLLNKSALS